MPSLPFPFFLFFFSSRDRQLGILTPEETIEALLRSGMTSDMSAREYIAFASQQRIAMGIDDTGGLGKALEAALAEQEKASGATLMVSDEDGMGELYSKVEDLIDELDLEGDLDEASMIEETEYEMDQLKAEMAKFA